MVHFFIWEKPIRCRLKFTNTNATQITGDRWIRWITKFEYEIFTNLHFANTNQAKKWNKQFEWNKKNIWKNVVKEMAQKKIETMGGKRYLFNFLHWAVIVFLFSIFSFFFVIPLIFWNFCGHNNYTRIQKKTTTFR